MYNEDIGENQFSPAEIYASRHPLFPPARHVLFHLRPVSDRNDRNTRQGVADDGVPKPELPGAQIKDDGIGSKYENMAKSWGKIQDYSAVDNIDREEPDKTRKSMNRNTRRTTSTCSRKNNRKKLRQRKLPLPRHENRKHLPNWRKHSQRRD